jgi:aminotransferase
MTPTAPAAVPAPGATNVAAAAASVQPTLTPPRVSQAVTALAPSGIRRFFDLIASTPGVISLGVGEPEFRTPEVIREAAIEHLRHGSMAYTSNRGMPDARKAVAEYLDRRFSVSYDPDQEMVLTVGASQAIDIAFRAILNPGDEVIVIQPCYVSYGPMVALAGGRPVYVATRLENEFVPDPKDIAAAITHRTRAIIFAYPNNPTGATYPPDVLRQIAALAEKHDLIVLSDEIYAELSYDAEHVCFPTLPGMKSRTILFNGFSKAFAMTGWRLGYACGPSDIIAGMIKVHQYSMLSAPTLPQAVARVALEKAQEDVKIMRAAYERRRHVVAKTFQDAGLPCPLPKGAFYAFADVRPTGLDDSAFCERLLAEKKVALVPGSGFGESGKGFIRACFALDDKSLAEAMRRLKEFLAGL